MFGRLIPVVLIFAARVALAGVTYTYDSAGHLIKADYGAAGVALYTYDAAGNLISRQVQGATGSGTAFLTGFALSSPSLRNDFSGWVGLKLTVGANPLSVSSLGRICVTNNAQAHTVKFVTASTGSDLAGASAAVNMAGCTAGQFVYTTISPITLAAGASYYVVSQETQGGDRWYDQGGVSTTGAAAVNSAVYGYNGSWIPINSANSSYVPPNFQYTIGTTAQYPLSTSVSPAGSGSISANPTSAGGSYPSGTSVQLTATPAPNCTFVNWTGTSAGAANALTVTMSAAQTVTANFQCSGQASTGFLTGYALSGQSLRNDFSGWVGMKLTVGTNPLTVSALGRICVANNASRHTVTFVNAGDGSDLAGASASVNLAGCTAGQFVYASISPVTLAPGVSYYLVSQETQGGDRWYDQSGISTTNVASVNNAVYAYNGSWFATNSTNTSYVPPSFQYTSSTTTQYVLTTSVSPSGGGSITANPTSPGGSYASGTPVQLTATPAGGCAFVNWTGTVSSSANPLTVTMSASETLTATFQCSSGGSPGTSFLTGYALSNPPLRNDFTGWVGMKLTVGSNPLTVSSLGRICVANNAQTHTVKLVTASSGNDLTGGSASVNMAGCTAGQFVYASISPITLPTSTTYYLVSQETQGGDQWYDQGSVSTTSAAAVNSAVYGYSGSWIPINSTNNSYVPPNFQYSSGGTTQYLLSTAVSPLGGGSISASPSSTGGFYQNGTSVQLTATPANGCSFVNWTGTSSGASNPLSVTMSAAQTVTANFQCSGPTATSFLTGYALNNPQTRNDYSGWVGMKLTVGSSSLTVSGLGRICISGNAQTHSVKFVNAGDGSDVPGGSALVNMAGCTAGQFVYTSLSPITLAAGSSYYLVSQETQGGDRWYDQGAVSSTAAATVNNSVYSYNGNWYSINSANTSYVPPSFQYQ